MASPLQSPRGGMLGDMPEEFRCPLSGDIMTDPVTLVETGVNFQRSAIEDWFARGLDKCPQTKRTLTNSRMVQNGELKRQVLAWLKAKRAELQSQARFAQPEQQPRGAGAAEPPGGQDPTQLANLMRQGRLNELIRQASNGLGGGDSAADVAVAATDAGNKPENSTAAASTAKGVARLSLNRNSGGAQPGGGTGNGGGYAKAPARPNLKRESSSDPSSPRRGAEPSEAPQPSTPKQAPPLPPGSDGSGGGRDALPPRYVRPSPAALQSPRASAAATTGPFVPKWLQGGDQPAAQQGEPPASAQSPDPQQNAPQQSEPPKLQQRQQAIQADTQQHTEHPHGPPPKTPSFDQWAHHDSDIPASSHSPNFHPPPGAAPTPTLWAKPEKQVPAQADASYPNSGGEAAAYQPSAQPSPQAHNVPSRGPDQQEVQPLSPPAAARADATGGSRPTDAGADRQPSPVHWDAAQHGSGQAPAAPDQAHAEPDLAAVVPPAVGSSSEGDDNLQQWMPPATSATEQQPGVMTHDSQQWQPPETSAAEQHTWQQPDAAQDPQQWQPPAASAAEQHTWQQTDAMQDSQQQQQQQQQQQSWPQHDWQQQDGGQPAQQQGWQQPERQQPAPDVSSSQPGGYMQEQQQQAQQYDHSWPQHSQPQQYDVQHQQYPSHQQQPYHQQGSTTTYKPATSEAYSWQDAGGSHTYHRSSSGYQHDSYSNTLAAIAASKERWSNTTRFPEWERPTDAQPGGQPGVPALSMAQRAELQGQQEAAAAGQQQHYGGEQPHGGSAPADAGAYYGRAQPASSGAPGYYNQSGDSTLIDKFGQREPDYSYYSGR